MVSRRRPRFVLDHDFPNSPVLTTRLPDIELVALSVLYPDLVANHADWQVLQQLKARGGGVDGFITLDANMLGLEKEMVVLEQTRLSLVVVERVNNDPITAGALVVAGAARIVRELDRRRAQIFRLRPPQFQQARPSEQLTRISAQSGEQLDDIKRRHRLTPAELQIDCRVT